MLQLAVLVAFDAWQASPSLVTRDGCDAWQASPSLVTRIAATWGGKLRRRLSRAWGAKKSAPPSCRRSLRFRSFTFSGLRAANAAISDQKDSCLCFIVVFMHATMLLHPERVAQPSFGGKTQYTFPMQKERTYSNAPIGVFDSGYGGLTVARALAERLPHEHIVYVGDSARCPYGPRDLREVDGFVQQIGGWLVNQGVKLLVIACNTATAAGLAHAQQTFAVPVVGVVEPGARAAVRATLNRRIGVIATKGTIESGAYSKAIRNLDAGMTVFSTAAPRFVEIAELGVRMAQGPVETFMSEASKVYIRPEFQKIALEYVDPLRRCHVDTLVLGCTHYPLLKSLIGGVVGREVKLISSATETAHDVAEMLARKGRLASSDNAAQWRFFTTGDDVEEFCRFGGRVFKTELHSVEHLDLTKF